MKWTWVRPHFFSTLLCALVLPSTLSVLLLLPTNYDQTPAQDPPLGASPTNQLVQPASSGYVNCGKAACLALTFDDGPDARLTPRILDILAEKRAKATFFLLGTNAAAHPDIVRRIYNEGHELGNHSMNHANLTYLSPAQINAQVMDAQTAIMAAGVPAPLWFRPPYGAIDSEVKAHVPLAIAMWNVDPEDWSKKDHNIIKDHINAHAGRGRIIDLHDTHGATADALPVIIDDLRMHYQLVTISELFDAGPGQRGVYYGR